MDFDFSEEQLAIRETIRELVQDKVAPRAAEIDQKAEYPKDLEELFAANGLMAIPFPEEYGGISAFVMEREQSPWATVKLERKLGIRGSPTAMLAFDEVRVPVANRLGDEGYGFKLALSVLDRSRPGIGAQALGIAEGALDYAIGYAKERTQFGQPVATFQGIQFMLADMATQIEGARHLVYLAATKVDEKAPDLTKVAAMAKLFASDTAMQVTTDEVQVLGC